MLISGLHAHLTAITTPLTEKFPHFREDKGRSPSKSREVSSARLKFQQSFGVLSVAVAGRALSLVTELFDDLHLEMCGGGGNIVQVGQFFFGLGFVGLYT